MIVTVQVQFAGGPEPVDFRFEGAERITLGRDAGCHIQIPDASVSSHHATLLRSEEHFVVVDERSTNGTLFNGKPVRGKAPPRLSEGDSVRLGRATLSVRFSSGPTKGASPEPSTQDLALAMVRGALLGSGSEVKIAIRVVSGVASGAQVIAHEERTYRLGSAPTSDLRLPGAAEEHTRVAVRNSRLSVMDLGAPGGTRLDGRALQPHRSVSWPPMAVLEVAGHRLCVDDPVSAALHQVESVPDERIADAVRSLPGEGGTQSGASLNATGQSTHSLRTSNGTGPWSGAGTESIGSAVGVAVPSASRATPVRRGRPYGRLRRWSWVDVFVGIVAIAALAVIVAAVVWFLLME